MQSHRLSDTDLLVPAFRERLAGVLKALVGQGFRPVVHETMRSHERALEMVAKGRSKARGGLSMHCYGVAADVICGEHQWQCRKHHCRFFEALRDQAEDMGLTSGGNWDRDERAGEAGENDLPHVQLPPLRLQDKVRACAPEHLDTLCRAILTGETR